jgi:carbamoylphosphate synthase large subunit
MPRTVGFPKTGGRRKGTPNQKTLELQEALEAHGVDVVGQLAELLPKLTDDRRTDVLLDLMGYLYPKRKAVEQQVAVDAKVEEAPERRIPFTEEQLREKLALLEGR